MDTIPHLALVAFAAVFTLGGLTVLFRRRGRKANPDNVSRKDDRRA